MKMEIIRVGFDITVLISLNKVKCLYKNRLFWIKQHEAVKLPTSFKILIFPILLFLFSHS